LLPKKQTGGARFGCAGLISHPRVTSGTQHLLFHSGQGYFIQQVRIQPLKKADH
jgi:hypothetical protein